MRERKKRRERERNFDRCEYGKVEEEKPSTNLTEDIEVSGGGFEGGNLKLMTGLADHVDRQRKQLTMSNDRT